MNSQSTQYNSSAMDIDQDFYTPGHSFVLPDRSRNKRRCIDDDSDDQHDREHPRKKRKVQGEDGHKLFLSVRLSTSECQTADRTEFTKTKNNPSRGNITQLATETLLQIFSYINPCAAVCLGLTTPRFYGIMKALYPTPKSVRLDITVGFKNRKKPSTELHTLLEDWMGPDYTYMGYTHFYKFYTPSALVRREAEKEKNRAKRQRWKDEKKYFKSYRAWAMFDRARSEGKGGFEKDKRIWYGGGKNRKCRPVGWVKKKKGAQKGAASVAAAAPPTTPAVTVNPSPVAPASTAPVGGPARLPPSSKKTAGIKAEEGSAMTGVVKTEALE